METGRTLNKLLVFSLISRNTIAVRREDLDKIGEQRCAIAPEQARSIVESGARLLVEPAVHPVTGDRKRIFEDEEYTRIGAEVSEGLSEADIIVGLKEVNVSKILPEKTYAFFSHTHKGQVKNRPLLRALMDADATLIDFELVVDADGRRLLTAFGSFAGYAGMVDTLWTFGRRLRAEGIRSSFAKVPQSIEVADLDRVRQLLAEAGERIATEGTPTEIPPVVVCILGRGRTSAGAQAMVDLLPTEQVTIGRLPEVFSGGRRNRVYKLVLEVDEMYRISKAYPEQRQAFDTMDESARIDLYLKHPMLFESNMDSILPFVSILVNCVNWTPAYPRTVPKGLMTDQWEGGTPLRVIGDVTCDPNGSIEFSRETWIDDPVFTYDPLSGEHRDGLDTNGVNVMAVTNLPCEFSRDASLKFSRELEPLLPSLLSAKLDGAPDESGLPAELLKAAILWRGQLTEPFSHLLELTQVRSKLR